MTDGTENYLLGCDWGTSSFRLSLLRRKDGKQLAGIQSGEGTALVFEAWRESELEREAHFKAVLLKYITQISTQVSLPLSGVPLILSGMASSSIGIRELPYATLPFALDGTHIQAARIKASEAFPHDILLVSGVKSETDVMRGEEIQLMGLGRHFPDDGIFIFPGTHSKHIRVQRGQMTSFQTFMTGEFFQLLTSRSILKDAVRKPESDAAHASPEALEAFRSGVKHAAGGNLLHAAFLTRTNYLFGKLDKTLNFYFLSGLLIGYELRVVKEVVNDAGNGGKVNRVVVCGGSNFTELYRQAGKELGIANKLLTVPNEIADSAASLGHFSLRHLL